MVIPTKTLPGAPVGTVRRDTELWGAVDAERARQEAQLELIASENHTSAEVIAAMGTVLTNKYAEGYPGRRYYGGCEHVDTVENLARERAKRLFGATHANVQAHSGTQANIAALMALAAPGERILAMSLDHGGHLSHGHPKNFSGVFYECHAYGVERDTERIDYGRVREQARKVRPRVLMAGASAYPRTIDFAAFASIAEEVDARLLVDMAHIAGLVAGGAHPSPVPHAAVTTMTTHKTPARPPGGADRVWQGHHQADQQRGLPGRSGGPVHARDRGQGGRARRGARAGFRGLRARGGRQRGGAGGWARRARPAHRLGRHGQPPHAGGRDPHGAVRGAGRDAPARGGHHLQQELDSLRRAPPDGGLGHPHRNRGESRRAASAARTCAAWRAGSPTCWRNPATRRSRPACAARSPSWPRPIPSTPDPPVWRWSADDPQRV